MARRILAVDDDPSILEVVALNLRAEGYEVDTVADGAEAMATFDAAVHALVILDVMLPDTDGFELARRIRSQADVPIMMLSARDTDIDKAVGLGVGADDYLTKPFSPVEFIARVKAHIRRYDREQESRGRHVDEAHHVAVAGPVELDVSARIARVRGQVVDLTAKEFDLLHLLVSHHGRAYTKEQIYAAVWGEHWGGDYSTVQVHIRRLRSKVESDPADPQLITTVWGIGYRFDVPGTDA
ncbi:MAG: response regulator transcription factor [Coriobacteriia bacterium]|nr:response regulator transcription factor [Coriobacteriia bacterium]